MALSPETSRIARIALHWRDLGYAVLPLIDKVPDGGRFGDIASLPVHLARRRVGDIYAADLYDRVEQGGLVLDGFRGVQPLAVVDVDDLTFLSQVREVVPHTPLESSTGRAGGGRHLWFRLDPRTTCGGHTAKQLGSDLKLRASFIVVPGSIHVSGVEYRAYVEGQPIDPLAISVDLLRSLPVLPHETVEDMLRGDDEWRRRRATQAPPRVVEIGAHQYSSGGSGVLRVPSGSLSEHYSCRDGERVYPPCCPESGSARSPHGKVSWRGESRTPLIYCFHHRHSIVEETEWKVKTTTTSTTSSTVGPVEPEPTFEEGVTAAQREAVLEDYRRRREGLPALVRVWETVGGEVYSKGARVVEETKLRTGVRGLTSKETLDLALRAVKVVDCTEVESPHEAILVGLQAIGQARVDQLVASATTSEAVLADVQADLDAVCSEVQKVKLPESVASTHLNSICPPLYREVETGSKVPLDILYTTEDKSDKAAFNLDFQPIVAKPAFNLDFQGVVEPSPQEKEVYQILSDPAESVSKTLAYLADRSRGSCTSGPNRHRAKNVVGAVIQSTRLACFSWGCPSCGHLLRDATRATTRLVLPAYAGWHVTWISDLKATSSASDERTIRRWLADDPENRTWLGVEVRPGTVEKLYAYSPDSAKPTGAMFEILNRGTGLADFAECFDVLLDAIDLQAWQEATCARALVLRGADDLRSRITDLRDGALGRWARTTRPKVEKAKESEVKVEKELEVKVKGTTSSFLDGGPDEPVQATSEDSSAPTGGYTEIQSYTRLETILGAAKDLADGDAQVTSIERAHVGTEVQWQARIEAADGSPLPAGSVLKTSFKAAGGKELHRKQREPLAKFATAHAQHTAEHGHSAFSFDLKLKRGVRRPKTQPPRDMSGDLLDDE
ncbi:MAG: bifunctional DNA primase/polymerase [Desulfurellales bacterium]|nr:MAG: bifunctional DNA primase/polymerase [Desulfurellales bacterium]